MIRQLAAAASLAAATATGAAAQQTPPISVAPLPAPDAAPGAPPIVSPGPGAPAAGAPSAPASLLPAAPSNPLSPAAPPAASGAPGGPAAAPAPAAAGRVFCDQTVTAQPADPASVPQDDRAFAGIFSDADWNPQTCAALVVEAIAPDNTATITYVFGPLGAGSRTPGGVLHGTGIVKDGSLLFQNSDGSQYAFKPYYVDLAGRWTTPQGQTYQAIFKRTY